MSSSLLDGYGNLLPLETHCPLCSRPFADFARTAEHIIPSWLQGRLNLRDRELTLPNGFRRKYRSIKVDVCSICNNERFSQLENKISSQWDKCAATETSFYEGSFDLGDEDFAVWLGKIFWLLARLGSDRPDPTTRKELDPDRVVPKALLPFIDWLGLYVSAYAHKKNAWSCCLEDTADSSNYGNSFSLYRFKIDDQGQAIEPFNFNDHYLANGIAIRIGDLGLICLFDDGHHARWRSPFYSDLLDTWVHSLQFSEIVARMFYDQLMLHDRARAFELYWNTPLNAVITRNLWPRSCDPYWAVNDDPEIYCELLNRVMPGGTHAAIERVGDEFTTFLRDRDGNIWDVVNNAPRQPQC